MGVTKDVGLRDYMNSRQTLRSPPLYSAFPFSCSLSWQVEVNFYLFNSNHNSIFVKILHVYFYTLIKVVDYMKSAVANNMQTIVSC